VNQDPAQSAESDSTTRRPYLLNPVPSHHQQESRRKIAKAAEAVSPGRVVLLGAGSCEDIPLAELVARFQKVTMNDVELAPLGRALAAAKIDQRSRQKITTHIGDLTGVTEPLLAKIKAVVTASTDADSAIKQMAALVAAQPAVGMAPAGKFDLVVASCVLSQLHFGLTHQARDVFAQRFEDQAEALVKDERWTAALYQLARRVEARFIDDLTSLIAADGLIYLSESTQMCYVEGTHSGQWKTEGTYRMLRTTELADYVDSRFTITDRGRWEWVVSPPAQVGQIGRLFDVQALVLRLAPH
jgi:hypothetical protein